MIDCYCLCGAEKTQLSGGDESLDYCPDCEEIVEWQNSDEPWIQKMREERNDG